MRGLLLPIILILLSTTSTFARDATNCTSILELQKIPAELQNYELVRDLKLAPTKDIASFSPKQGIFVTKRDSQEQPTDAIIRVLSDNPGNVIEVVGDFNNWGHQGDAVRLHPDDDPHYMTGDLHGISHGMQYRLVVNGQQLIDPAAIVQSSGTYLNSVFWDIEGVGKYEMKNRPIHLGATGGVAVSENELLSLAKRWNFNGQIGPKNTSDTFKFITESGLIDKLKDWGVNAIELLPITASVDGDVWAYRFLSYSSFSLDSRWGTPAELARMVDTFNGAGVGIILGIVPGHYAQNGNLGVRSLGPIGIQNFKKSDGQALYGQTLSEWGTYRYDYLNPYVRRYLIDSVINIIKYMRISGIRIDNFGGIQSLPGGSQFLRELIAEVRAYSPTTYINAESFGGDNSITTRIDQGGYGASTHNNGDFFGFIFAMAQKRTEEIDMNMLRNTLRNPWGWRESATIDYITNHDEAANGRGHASGAYFATLVNGGGWNYVEGKTKTFASLAMLSSSFYLDMPQLRILQEGTFYQNPNVEWSNLQFDSQKHVSDFFSDLTKYYTHSAAFAFFNTHADIENHTDNDNKIISIKRIDFQTGKTIYVLINLGDRSFEKYRFGISDNAQFRIAIDSDGVKYGGSNRLVNTIGGNYIHSDSTGDHGKPNSLILPYVAPFSVTVFEQQ